MELRTLRYFSAVLEAGSLSRAAGSLFIAQPALTAQIKKLEDELGAQLFERSYAGVTPTPAGLQLYEDARRLLSDADALRERMRRLPTGPEGSVTLALPFLLASLLTGPLLMRLKHTHPRIRVFVLDDLSLQVRQAMQVRRADIGVLVDAPRWTACAAGRWCARPCIFAATTWMAPWRRCSSSPVRAPGLWRAPPLPLPRPSACRWCCNRAARPSAGRWRKRRPRWMWCPTWCTSKTPPACCAR
jgi:DNA-binding transcriptional LysR family regulator